MKKLFFTVVFALGSLTAFAQEEATESQEVATEAVAQGDFSEITLEEVPQAVTDMIQTNYPGATISKAHKNSQNHYKLDVSLEDGTTGTLVVDEEGNTIQ